MSILVQLAFMIEIQPAFYDAVHELLMEDIYKPYYPPNKLIVPIGTPQDIIDQWIEWGYELSFANKVVPNILTFEEQVLAGWEHAKKLSKLYNERDPRKDVMIVSPQVYNEFMENEDAM